MTARYKSAGALVQAVKIARSNPDARFNVPGGFPLYAKDILDNFAAGVMRRCNRGLPSTDEQRYIDLRHDARVINDAANRIRWPGRNVLRTRRLALRYPHIHNPNSEA